jgi:RNA polymerase sigma factor (sigma-70 family)
MDDREVVAAIAAGDPAGIAAAYDRHAAALYGYCQWLMTQPAAAAEVLRDTFVVATAAIGDLDHPAKLRPWLYALARHEGYRRLRTTVPVHDEPADADDQPAAAADRADRPPTPAWQANDEELPDIRSDLKPAEMLNVIRGILAELPPREREVIELSLRHNLHDDDLAEGLGVSSSRANVLTERARGRLEKALGALLVVRIGLQACPELGTLLVEWDGRLTEEARDLIAGHIEHCETCAARRRATLRPAALSGLQPLVPLPPGLRQQVLKLSSSATPDVVVYRQHATRRAETVWRTRVVQVITLIRWRSIRANPGRAIAAAVVVIWVVAAVGAIMLTFAGSHAARTLATRPNASSPSASPAALAAPAAGLVSQTASAKPSPRVTHSRTLAPPVESSPTSVESSSSRSAKPSPSRSPKPSTSSSPSPSPSKSPSPSPSPSASVSPSSSPSPSPPNTS